MFTLVGLLQSIVLIMCAIVLFRYGKKCYSLPDYGYVDKPEDDMNDDANCEESGSSH